MAATANTDGLDTPPRRKRRVLRRAGFILLGALLILIAVAWLGRDRIARTLITDELEALGVDATYTIDSIGPRYQVVSNIVVGDPDQPDLRIDRATLRVTPRFGLPAITSVTLENPQLYGRIVDGKASFGALDPLIFTDSDEPFEFPDMVLHVRGGRGLIEGDYGPVGISLSGQGHLRGGFVGELGAVAPRLALAGCTASGATLYGRIQVDAERPRFAGPLRYDSLTCDDAGILLEGGEMALVFRAERNLVDFEGESTFRTGSARSDVGTLGGLEGEGQFTWRQGALVLGYDLVARDVVTGPALLALVDSQGILRARDGFSRLELDGDIEGKGVQLGETLETTLAGLERGSDGTLLAPLARKFRRALFLESRGSELSANFTARQDGDRTSVVVPEARLRGTSGSVLFALTRGQFADGGEQATLLTGNFVTGGRDMPRISGQAQRNADGSLTYDIRMAAYEAGDANLAMPRLLVRQSRSGALGLGGEILASGPLPGGSAQGLRLRVTGMYAQGELSLWEHCTQIGFEELALASLSFDKQELTLCPAAGSSILRYGAGGLKIAAGTGSLDLSGKLGETPITIASGPVGFAWPGTMTAERLDIAIGPPQDASRFTVSNVTGRFGDDIGGRFEGADIQLASVPMDMRHAKGAWTYEKGRVEIGDGAFTLVDREQVPRFNPLTASGARLSLDDNVILADAVLRELASGFAVTDVHVRHDLETSAGHADLDVRALTFGPNLQPDDLTDNALGVVANVEGTITGTGRIDWSASGEITSTGSFSSDSLDFAAAFGVVEGASGTVNFIDLVGLTTAPDQHIRMKMVNPGIEIFDGEMAFSLTDGEVLRFEKGTWPFLGGTLTMQPLTLTIGAEEERRYVFVIDGLQASRFIERMELSNLAATGTFDGTIPVIFDKEGNGRLEDGLLVARPPGGNLSYIGQLTYEDLSYMGNFAFQTLRDLKYDEMEVVMNGPLAGELVTQVRFEGVGQGESAKTNIITRQLANLPIQLLVNIRAPFYRLMTSLKSLYDPSAVRDPRGLGLLTDDGTALRREIDLTTVEAEEAAREAASEEARETSRDEPDIQPPESEAMP